MPENAKNAKFCRSHIKRKKRKKNIKIDIIIYYFGSNNLIPFALG